MLGITNFREKNPQNKHLAAEISDSEQNTQMIHVSGTINFGAYMRITGRLVLYFPLQDTI